MNFSDFQAVKRYAKAYVELGADVDGLASAVAAAADVRALFDPTVPKQKKKSFVEEVFAADKNIINLFCLLVDADRINFLTALNEEAQKLDAKKQGLTRVNITSAYDLSDNAKKAVEAAAQKFFGGAVVAEYKQDAGLIGGVIIQNEDLTIDASISGGLKRLEESLR